MTLDQQIAAAKREVRRTYDGPRAQYPAAERKLDRLQTEKKLACPCECNAGQFCGGCGHAGCGGRK